MSSTPPFPDVRSLWQDTAVDRPAFGRLAGEHRYDVAIVGGGYTGLSTARYLALAGLQPVVLEASRIGWGASGRNGGVVSGKFRVSYPDMAGRFGKDIARRMHDLALEAIDHVGELTRVYGIAAADYRPNGSLRCAHNALTFKALQDETLWLQRELGDAGCSILQAGEVAAETGSRDFVGGMLNTHGGIVHPLNFVLGLAGGLKNDGVAIFEQSPVTGIRRNGQGVLVQTPAGTVTARQVVIATDGYSDLTPATAPVRKAIIPFRSAMIATAPLAGTPGEHLLKTDRSYTETRRMMRWFRKYDGRLLYGGRGAFGKEDSDSAFAALGKAMVRQFPELESVDVTHRWSGLVAMTLDSLPHAGRLDEHVVYCVGYNGTGVAMASNMGRYVARIVTGETTDAGLVSSLPLKNVPFYGLREPAVRLVAGWYQFLDAVGR